MPSIMPSTPSSPYRYPYTVLNCFGMLVERRVSWWNVSGVPEGTSLSVRRPMFSSRNEARIWHEVFDGFVVVDRGGDY